MEKQTYKNRLHLIKSTSHMLISLNHYAPANKWPTDSNTLCIQTKAPHGFDCLRECAKKSMIPFGEKKSKLYWTREIIKGVKPRERDT